MLLLDYVSGFISTNGHYPYQEGGAFQRWLAVGPMARFACDLKPMLKVMAGEKAILLNLDEEASLSNNCKP